MALSLHRLLGLALAASLVSCSALDQESEVQIRDASARLGSNAVHMMDADGIVDAEPALRSDLLNKTYAPRIDTGSAAVRDLVVDPDPVASRGDTEIRANSGKVLSGLVVDPDPVASRR